MKKVIAWFVVACFLFTYGANYYLLAAASLGKDEIRTINNNETKSTSTDVVAKGNLEIDLKLELPIRNTLETNMSINIINDKGEILNIPFGESKEPVLNTYKYQGDNVQVKVRKLNNLGLDLSGVYKDDSLIYVGVSVYDLRKGTYTVELTGKGYKPYQVNVTLDEYSKRVSLSNTSGMFEAGDVNSDQEVDSKDIDYIISHFGTNDDKLDLNRDGLVDVADLNYITAIMNGEKSEAVVVDTSVIMDSNSVILTGTDATLEDLLDGDKTVSIAPAISGDITESNPASISLTMVEPVEMSEIRLDLPNDNYPELFDVIVEHADGTSETISDLTFTASRSEDKFTDEASPNTKVIELDGQVAVKKVTIKIKKSAGKNLSEIGKVEFLNNVYKEVPEVHVDLPTGLSVKAGSEEATVTFNNMPNVTGYEILVEELKEGTDEVIKQNVYQTTYNSYTVEELDNYTTYNVKVQSVNGEWKSGYTSEVKVTPIPTRKPPSVDMVVLTPVYRGFDVGWKKMKDTLTYNLYYRELGETKYEVIRNISGTSKSLRDLKVETTYEVYLTGNNDLGEGSPSAITKGETKNTAPTIYPKYKLLNTSNGRGNVTNHVKDVIYGFGTMSNNDKFDIVDEDHLSYWGISDWEAGVTYYRPGTPVIVLDNEYELKDFVVTIPDNHNYSYYQACIYYYDSDVINDKSYKRVNATISQRRDENNRIYYVIKGEHSFKASRVQVSVSAYGGGNVKISEVKIYKYDSLEDDVSALFTDDLRVELSKEATLSRIEELERRANSIDEESQEYHPDKDVILNDLSYAKSLLNDKGVRDVITVDTSISTQNDGHLGFAMSISDYQPLGIVARAGEKITVYVGSTGNVMPEVVFTQYYAEANVWNSTVRNLHKGQNIIEVPKIGSMDTERGGSVYIRYPRTTGSETLKVRVSGGTKIPVLDLHNVKDESEKKTLIGKYVTELESYVNNLDSVYKKEGLTYDPRTSVLNSTEIVTEEGLLSIPANTTYAAISDKLTSNSDKIDRVLETTKAFDEMVNLFYRHKGLSKNAENSKDKAPTSRINIRYMRMFDGAFMYAGGLHIGIGYDSTGGLLTGKVMGDDFAGYFGWGISHEIGHQINQSKLVHAEVTNNVYALLAQTADDESKSRLEVSEIYPKIYEKVTSGTQGKSSNVFVTLGMYWQLHLAYDNGKTFTDTNSIFSRINKLTRNGSLTGDKDDLLVMYASDAAEENLIPFFTKWGLNISETAKKYVLEKYSDKPSKAIWYLNDEARRYRLAGKDGISSGVKAQASMDTSESNNKRVTLNLGVNKESEKILGYEIIRNGETIMFTTENTFTDIIGALNNRAVTYEVIAYDYLLNKTESYVFDEIKVEHDGSIVKNNFDIESNFKGSDEVIDPEDPDMKYDELSVNYLIDGLDDTSFNGTVRVNEKDTEDAYIIIDLNSKLSLSGIKYKARLENGSLAENTMSDYEVYVSSDKVNWKLAKKGTFNLNQDNSYTEIVYFDREGTTGGNQLWTYTDISYVKIVSVGNKSGMSGVEIDLIAPPGDNISLDSYGILDEDYCYTVDSTKEQECIKKGMVVFKGTYRGNPAYNAVLLVDGYDDSVVFDGEEIFFAKLASDAGVYEVASGTWIFAVTQEEYAKMVGHTIRAELYRVDDPVSLDGQRLTSTSLRTEELPKTLGNIVIK